MPTDTLIALILSLVGGEKGGGGKSFFAKLLIQYCIDRSIPFTAIETDRSNPDVAAVYPKYCDHAVFSEDDKQLFKADRIFEHAIEKPVIVSLPSQSHRAVSKWLEHNQLFEVAKQHKVSLVQWFVCTGRYDSVQLLIKSLEHYQDRMPHIIVRNWAFCDDWSHADEDPKLQKLIKKYQVKTIDLPELSYREAYLIDKHRLNFGEAVESSQLTLMGRQRVKNFLDNIYESIDSTEVFKVNESEDK
ncbi:MAG: mobilization protein [Cyanobacteria bacterium J06631_2]